MGGLSMANENHNISNTIWKDKGWKTGMFVELGETNNPGWTCMMATWVTDISFMLSFLANFKFLKVTSYFIHVNTPLPEHMKFNTQF